MAKPDYDTTVARIAGNIASGYISDPACTFPMDKGMERKMAELFVSMARAIVAEVKRTEPRLNAGCGVAGCQDCGCSGEQ